MTQHFTSTSAARPGQTPASFEGATDDTRQGFVAISAGASERLVERMLVALGKRDVKAEAHACGMAMRGATDDQLPRLVDSLVGLVDTAAGEIALGYAARGFVRLPDANAQQLLVSGLGQWAAAARAGLMQALPGERASITALIGAACDPEAFAVLCDLIGDEERDVADAAGRALLRIAHRVNAQPPVDALTRQGAEAAIVRAASEFDKHRQKPALKALLVLLNSPSAMAAAGPEVRALLNDDAHPAHMGIRGIIKNDIDVQVTGAAWLWLSHKRSAPACVQRLGSAVDARRAIGERSHLALNPLRKNALARAAKTGKGDVLDFLAPSEDELAASEGQLGAHTLGIATLATTSAALSASESVLGHADPLLRHAGVRLLGDAVPCGTSSSISTLLDYCFDGHEGVAKAAATRAWHAARDGRIDAAEASAVFERLRKSPHASVRALAHFAGAPPVGAADGPVQRQVLRRWLETDREGLVETVRERLHNGPLADRVGAIVLSRRLGLGVEIELDLLAIIDRSVTLCKRPADAIVRHEMRVAASAVTALGDVETQVSRQALLKTLAHPDDRVRANAVDAWARLARRSGEIRHVAGPAQDRIIELKTDPNHRVRAGAVRLEMHSAQRQVSLLASGNQTTVGQRAVAEAAGLLADDRPMHRVSGLWLTERLATELAASTRDAVAAQTLVEVIQTLAQTDPDSVVRARASTTTLRLKAAVRHGWSGRAAAIPAGL